MSDAAAKRQHGRYYTIRNPFSHAAFLAWAARAGLPDAALIEPFAGSNNIVRMLEDLGLVGRSVSYDIHPAAPDVLRRDVFQSYPSHDGVVVTNPPYMARNSARRRGFDFPETAFSDLYLYSLDLMLRHHAFVAAIIPAAFGTQAHFRDRLSHLITLPFNDIFGDTDHPVALALFEPDSVGASVWHWDTFLGSEAFIRNAIPELAELVDIRFNDPRGLVGLRAVDGTKHESIRFCRGEEIAPDRIKVSSRSVSRLTIEGLRPQDIDTFIHLANEELRAIRRMTRDVILTPFKGLRQDGAFRRRLDFRTARIIATLAMQKGLTQDVSTDLPLPDVRSA